MNALNDVLLEEVLDPDNLWAAWRAVKANRGAPGIDGIGIGETAAHLHRHWSGIKGKLLAGTYKPAPVRAVRIPKPGGGERGLGIPNTTDRLIQQALHQKLSPVLEPVFSDRSYGYRPGRSAHDAIRAARRHVVEEQRRWVIDVDIEGFFDNLDHDLLMRDLARHVSDKRVLRLIGKYLRAGVLEDGRVRRGTTGAPQGGPLSPLLANLYLDRLDREMESRGLAFVRYADDITVYAKSPRSAERIHARLVGWIEKHLKLRVNREKSGIRPPEAGSFLGFTIGAGGEIGISAKSVGRYKARVREFWDGRNSQPLRERRRDWLRYVRGWWQYYRLCDVRWVVKALSSWTRRHMRKAFWLRWHDWRGRRNAMARLGATGRTLRLAHSGRGAWRAALALNRVLTIARLQRWGLLTPVDFVDAPW